MSSQSMTLLWGRVNTTTERKCSLSSFTPAISGVLMQIAALPFTFSWLTARPHKVLQIRLTLVVTISRNAARTSPATTARIITAGRFQPNRAFRSIMGLVHIKTRCW